MDSIAAFRRGQVERAIARIQKVSWIEVGTQLRELRADLKRLIDIDRRPLAVELKSYERRRAFADGVGPQTGIDAHYSPYQAFALLIAYRLTESGITQSRVVLFLRQIRPHLESAFEMLTSVEPAGSDQQELERRILAGELVTKAKDSIFLLVRTGTKALIIPGIDPVSGGSMPASICSYEQLGDIVMRLDHYGEAITVLPVTNAAHQIVAVLQRTPATSRGRPRSKPI